MTLPVQSGKPSSARRSLLRRQTAAAARRVSGTSRSPTRTRSHCPGLSRRSARDVLRCRRASQAPGQRPSSWNFGKQQFEEPLRERVVERSDRVRQRFAAAPCATRLSVSAAMSATMRCRAATSRAWRMDWVMPAQRDALQAEQVPLRDDARELAVTHDEQLVKAPARISASPSARCSVRRATQAARSLPAARALPARRRAARRVPIRSSSVKTPSGRRWLSTTAIVRTLLAHALQRLAPPLLRLCSTRVRAARAS